MQYEAIEYEKQEGYAIIVLNRPERLNALNGTMLAELEAALQDANSETSVKVLVVTGSGRAFCSGADTSVLAESDRIFDRLIGKSPQAGGLRSISLQLKNVEKPIIAAVNGLAVGAGMSLAMACDIRIASEKAGFSQIFTRRGLVPDTGSSYFLPRLVGLSMACEMVFTGSTLDAARAKECGLVSRVVPHDDLMTVALALAREIGRCAPRAVKLAKKALYHGAESDLATALEFEGLLQGYCFQTRDFKEALLALKEKRDPVFEGR